MKALTLRLPDEMHEALRRESFERRMPITVGCDVCGNPKVVHVSTPGGFRFCAEHHHPVRSTGEPEQ